MPSSVERNLECLSANTLGALVVAVSDVVAEGAAQSDSSEAALLTLLHWQPVQTTELAAVIGLSQSATTRLIAGLREQGLVAAGAKAGREVPLMLTPAGRAEAQALQHRRLSALDHVLAPLTAAERAGFDAAVSKILAGLVRDKPHARRMCRKCDHGVCDGPLCPTGEAARRLEA